MSHLKSIFSSEIVQVGLVLLIVNIIIFWKFYFQGLLPFPGDLLVSFYFPWNSGGFLGFDQWTTHKDVISADVIRQIYPWKNLAIDMIKNGQVPLWNPYNFSGTPLLANLQSSVFFPGNILLVIFPLIKGWTILVVMLPFLYSIFSYLFLRSLKLQQLSALFGAIVMSNISYFLVWSEQLVIIQSALFLPLILFFLNKYSRLGKNFYPLLISLCLAFSIFSGHLQTVVYVYIITMAYALYKKISLPKIFLILFFSFGLSAVQLIPSFELYLHSAREGESTRVMFASSIIPLKNLITLLAPDFFGNPATGNFWGRDYGNFQMSIGITAFILSLISLFTIHKDGLTKFFALLSMFALIFSATPLANILSILSVPVLSSGSASRMIFIFQFSLSVLAAIGLHKLLSIKKSRLIPLLAILFAFLSLWLVTFINRDANFLVSQKNLLLPFGVFIASSVVILFSSKFPKVLAVLLIFAAVEYFYFLNKYQPFTPEKFVFPSHPVFNFLSEKSPDRFYGTGTAYVDNNFATQYRVFSAEGYDSLYIKRYGQLLASTKDGKVSTQIPRSDATFAMEESSNKEKILDLSGVKYLLDKNDNPKWNWEPQTYKFPEDRYQLVWQKLKWKAYERKTVLPRAFLADSYIIHKSDKELIHAIFDPKIDLKKTLILEQDPHWNIESGGDGVVKLTQYEPNKVKLEVTTEKPKALFLSDAFYPGWKATIDGKVTKIFRADFTFRAIEIPSGNHTILFNYDPESFMMGKLISLISCAILILFLFKEVLRKRRMTL